MCSSINPAAEPVEVRADDLDAQIAQRESELAALIQRRRDRDHAALKFAILQLLDDWFEARELRARMPLSPTLSAQWAGLSAKAIGRRLNGIADADDRSGTVPPLRLLRHKTTTKGTVWKIETYQPTSAAPAGGR